MSKSTRNSSSVSDDFANEFGLKEKPNAVNNIAPTQKTDTTKKNISDSFAGEFGLKKKEDTNGVSGDSRNGITSGSQLQSTLGKENDHPQLKQQVSNDVKQIVNDHFQSLVIQSSKDKQDFKPIIKGVENGDPASISLLRNKISGLYDQQIQDLRSAGYPIGGAAFVLNDDQQSKVNELIAKKDAINKTLNQYGSYFFTIFD